MTYLQLVNKVLTRLREENVSTVSQTTYSALIGEFVNDAKRAVENAWDWSSLYQTITANTSSGDYQYTLTDSGRYSTIETVINDTQNGFMHYRDRNWFENSLYNLDDTQASPAYWGNDGIDSNGDLKIRVFPKPDGVYALRFNIFKRQTELSADADTLSIPWEPVMHLAVALASRERGETGGTSAAELFGLADVSLSDAVAMDANRTPEKLVFQEV